MTPEGYPDDAELEAIAKWPHGQGYHELMAFVRRLRWTQYGGWRQEEAYAEQLTRYTLATGGWSGNESLISALKQNWVFWACCWQKSERGGLYVFEVPIEEPKCDPN